MSDRKRITLADAYEQYMAANINMKPLGRDHWHRRWPLINPVLGHLYLDEVTTLIIAGHETSAGTLNWAWYLLSQHPQADALTTFFQKQDSRVFVKRLPHLHR